MSDDDCEIKAEKSRVSDAVIADLMQYEPTTLVMDLLEAHGFDFIIGLRTPQGSTLTITSRGARQPKSANLRGHVRKSMSSKADD